ncbi:MAG: PAS domain S-box protein [Pseudomonadota bacterium]
MTLAKKKPVLPIRSAWYSPSWRLLSVGVLLIPLGITFYAWKTTHYFIEEKTNSQFKTLTLESEKALLYRIDSYEQSLVGASGLLYGSSTVSKTEWDTYVKTIGIKEHLPGMNGLGFIEYVSPVDIEQFLKSAQVEHSSSFTIHPHGNYHEYLIVKYIAPIENNAEALGLNIAFETNRYEAALLARDSGQTIITQRILLVQDHTKSPGFYLLLPVYKNNYPIRTAQERRKASLGWIFGPFIAKNFLHGLTSSQGHLFHLKVYDGTIASKEHLIYDSGHSLHDTSTNAQYSFRQTLDIKRQLWTLEWSSTPLFEKSVSSNEPILILAGGSLFTGLLGLILLMLARRAKTVQKLVEEKTHEVIASEEQMKMLIRHTPAAVAMFDQSMHYLMTSERWLIDYNLAGLDVTGRSHYELFPEILNMPEWQEHHRQALQGKSLSNEEDSWKRADGKTEWVKWAIHPWQNAEGAVGGIVMFTEVITERKETQIRTQLLQEIALEAAEATSLESMIQTVLDKMCLHLKWPLGHAYIWNDTHQELESMRLWHFGKEHYQHSEFRQVSEVMEFTAGMSLPGRVLDLKEPVFLLDVATSNHFLRNQVLANLDLHAGIFIPILLKQEVKIVLEFFSNDYIPESKTFHEFNQMLSIQLSRVIERKQAEEALKESQGRYELAVQGSSVGLWDWDIHTHSMYYSPRFLEILGVLPENMPSFNHMKQLEQRIHADDATFVQTMLMAHLRNKQAYNLEFRLRKEDGSYAWVHVRGQAIWNEMNRPLRMAGSIDDITNRKIAEKELEDSNSLNNAILYSAPYLVIATDKKGEILVFNRTAEAALGYQASEIIGKHSPLLWHDEREVKQRADALSEEWGFTVHPDFEVFTRPLILNESHTSEWTYICRNGSKFSGQLTITPIWSNLGLIMGYLGIVEDITERKQHELALKSSEETFRSAMEHASIGMALVEPNGRWLKVNQVLCDLLGYSKLELLSMDFQSITHPDDLESDLEFVRQMLEGKRQTYQMEKRFFRKDKSNIWVQLSVSIVHTNEGLPHYLIAQIQDITERKEMERMKNEFISIVSHELRTPLTSIRGSLGLIAGAMSKDLPDKANLLINIAHKNSERLILLINDILDIDKIASGQMRFDMHYESLAAVLQQAIDANNAYAERFNVSFRLIPPLETWKVNIDNARLLQVLSNILSNAAKFSPEGHSVEVFAMLAETGVRICVKDYGPGISEEFRSRIFGKFSQADSSATRKKDGTGLGLHVSKQIIEHMGGQIGFDTIIGKGTTFWIELPLLVETNEEALLQTPSHPRYRLLVCEDNQEIASLMKIMIENASFNVDIAHTIPEARRKLHEVHYDAMTLDLLLPIGDGIKFLHELRTDPATCHLPIVVVSASAEQARQSMNDDAVGVVDWLMKPIDELRLIQSIKRCIQDAHRPTPRILHIEDDIDLSHMLATALQDKAEIITATTLRQAEHYLKTESFTLIILDIALPDGSGLNLLEHLHEYTSKPIPVLILSANEVSRQIQHKVAAALVKSRLSETKIVDVILKIIQHN